MQIPILNGIYASDIEVRTAYPRNLIPIPKETGLSGGYLRPSEGIIQFDDGTAPGLDRGGINWNGVCYRVLGNRFCSIASDGTITIIGVVGNDGLPVSMDYSFDRLAIASDSKLYYYDGATLTVVTDPDLGVALDVIWVDGYFMTTDGEYIVVTELLDPAAVDPLKYGSSETDPDPVVGILKIAAEPYAVNRYSVEAFSNVGGSGFPYSRIDGARLDRGAVGTHAFCRYIDGMAFLGSGRDEAIAVWYGYGGGTTKLSSDEIDMIIRGYTEAELALVEVERRVVDGHDYLYIHFPDATYVYDHNATQAAGEVVWYILNSAVLNDGTEYRARHFVNCYNKWLVGDTVNQQVGYLTDTIGSHWGTIVGWEFQTDVLYNTGKSGIIHEIEMFGLPGKAAYGENPTIWTSYSTDGETFGAEHPISCGTLGQTQKRLVWFGQGLINKWRIQKFRGLSDARLPIIRLEATVEALNY